MNIEEIGEPIRVLATFSGGSAEPVRFRWSGRTYNIDAVNARWADRSGGGYSLHYSVQVGDEIYYIHFASGEVQWWLAKYIPDLERNEPRNVGVVVRSADGQLVWRFMKMETFAKFRPPCC